MSNVYKILNNNPQISYNVSWRNFPKAHPGGLGQIFQSNQSSNKQLTVLTVNIQAYDTCGNCDELFCKINNLGADVICIQEDLESSPTDKLKDYLLLGTCIAEEMSDTYLANRVYIKDTLEHHIIMIRNFDISEGCDVPRCAVYININGISLVNVHLSGGRFDDPEYEKLANIKQHQIEKIIESVSIPDLIVGDFNAESTIEQAYKSLVNYPLFTNLSNKNKSMFLYYYTSHHSILKDYGYEPAYTIEEVGSTSKFGGTPDWMYYQQSRLTPISIYTIPLLKYTDHNGVMVTFSIN